MRLVMEMTMKLLPLTPLLLPLLLMRLVRTSSDLNAVPRQKYRRSLNDQNRTNKQMRGVDIHQQRLFAGLFGVVQMWQQPCAHTQRPEYFGSNVECKTWLSAFSPGVQRNAHIPKKLPGRLFAA
mmetsp:Transcript_25697/g.36274  ORF Transcript_25697/g.36274 Transcript_25697/m.36274 type:complete len:124 (+) Transcript_25697:235-606(+)